MSYQSFGEALKYAYPHTYTKMTSKNIMIREDVYRRLLEGKREDESFSDAISRLLEGKNDLMSYAGIMSGDEEFERAVRDIPEVRKRTLLRA